MYVEDRTNILSRIEYLRNYNDNENNEDWGYQPENTEDIVLVDRESDCQNTQNTQNTTNELTMEKCIEFLSSKGFSVALTQK